MEIVPSVVKDDTQSGLTFGRLRWFVVAKRNDSSLCITLLAVALSCYRGAGRRCIGNVGRGNSVRSRNDACIHCERTLHEDET